MLYFLLDAICLHGNVRGAANQAPIQPVLFASVIQIYVDKSFMYTYWQTYTSMRNGTKFIRLMRKKIHWNMNEE